jgi:hypothetical protein
MKKKEVMEFLLERVYCRFEFGKEEDRTLVEVFNDSQAQPFAGYDYRVVITKSKQQEVYGSYATWGADCKVRLFPYEESATLRLLRDNEGELALFLIRFKRTGLEFRDWRHLMELGLAGQSVEEAVATRAPDLIEVRRICSLEEVENLYAETTSGWRVEFFKERLPGEKAGQEGDRWVGILHRSNGSVTICRRREDFPF